MKTTADFLDDLQVKLCVKSDYAVGKLLEIHRQTLSHYRLKKGAFDDEMSLRVAEILELDSAYVMACMHHQRAKQPEVKAAWAHAAEVLYGLAAALAIMAILPTFTLPDYALSSVAFVGSISSECILCQISYLSAFALYSAFSLAVAAFIMKRLHTQAKK